MSDLQILEMYKYHLSGKKFQEVAEKFGLNNITAVYRLFKKLGLKAQRVSRPAIKTKERLAKAEKKKTDQAAALKLRGDIWERLYVSGYSTQQIADKYSMNREVIAKELFRVRKIEKKRIGHWVNEDFFSIIDSEIKAYLLGFFYADGCIYDNNIQILIQQRDVYVLELFKKYICPDVKISVFNSKSDGVNRKPQARFKIQSKKIVSDLAKLGYKSRKTYDPDFSMSFLPEELKRHFVRGFLDGDGSWGFYPNGHTMKRSLVYCGMCKKFLLEIQEFYSEIGVELKLTSSLTRAGLEFYYLSYYKQSGYGPIYDLLYKDANYFLERKRLKGYYCTLTPRELEDLKISQPRNA